MGKIENFLLYWVRPGIPNVVYLGTGGNLKVVYSHLLPQERRNSVCVSDLLPRSISFRTPFWDVSITGTYDIVLRLIGVYYLSWSCKEIAP